MRPTLLVITIGQTPRTDLTPQLRLRWPDVTVRERGLLDGMTATQIGQLKGGRDTDLLVARLTDGSSVTLPEHWVAAAMERAIAQSVRERIDVVLVACSGHFDVATSGGPHIVFTDRALRGAVDGLSGDDRPLQVIVPHPSQEAEMHTRWASRGRDLTVASMDPYAVPIDVSAEVSARLNGRRDALIVLDCIGYRSDHAAHLSRMTGAAVLTARDAAIAMTGLLLQTLTDNRKDPYDPAASTRTVRSPRLPFRER